MANLIVISWRDIPAQVIAKRGSDAYLADWRRTPRSCGDDLNAEAAAEAARLDALYTDEDLERVIRAKGIDERIARPTEGDPAPGSEVP